ncbi:TorD/DmsD family molecular chaperone [Campylobacter gastrosuis]|uniref:Molecular chaperone TorD family protein n=1 Tax=Campylobacter gastrosuis TaxID=2974576 RepID=A0ABT7HSK4_9BACT|nr:molecular chaperone TorD family protein [Campylobacter gastrosuis]MDL0089814.1 molecular chaperone TorD family protein [Campylobacter gastrosuis]MDL0089840.1 molecular chaperone TorD family protein [Campylobacter gastrosuis]
MEILAQNTIKNSLFVEDFLRRIFLQELKKQEFSEILTLCEEFEPKFKEHAFIKELCKISTDDVLLDDLRYEFNRLFVGPRRPKALPYESTYFDYKNMFGTQTFEVRAFYKRAGLRVDDEQFDKFPDDYIGFELQYLYFMSYNMLAYADDDKAKFEELAEQKAEFVSLHTMWFRDFAKASSEATKLVVWKYFGEFLNLYLENEIINLAPFSKK